jgi:hypothetical protein
MNPGLQMARAGAQYDTRLMAVCAHGLDDLVLGTIQIDENIAGIAVAAKRVEEDVVTVAIALACRVRKNPRSMIGTLTSAPEPPC